MTLLGAAADVTDEEIETCEKCQTFIREHANKRERRVLSLRERVAIVHVVNHTNKLREL